MTDVYVSLGSAVGDSPGYIREALGQLAALGTNLVNSDLYTTAVFQSDAQANSSTGAQTCYYMVVARLETELSLEEFQQKLRSLERHYAAGARPDSSGDPPDSGGDPLQLRVLGGGASTLDMHCDSELSTEGHQGWSRRAEVLVPLSDLWRQLAEESQQAKLKQLLARLTAAETGAVRKIPDTAYLRKPLPVDYDAPSGAGSAYHELRPLSRFDSLVFAQLARMIPLQDAQVLDVGCGTGRFSILLAQQGAHVTGLDNSETMLAQARSAGTPSRGSIVYQRADANAFLPQGPFDAVTFFFSAQYMSLRADFWNRLKAALRPGGVAAFITFPHRHFVEGELTRYFPGIARIDLARFPSIPALGGHFRENGFQDVAAHEVVHADVISAQDYLERVRRKYLSTFHLMDAGEFAAGVEAMQNSLAGRPAVERTLRAVVVAGRRTARGRRTAVQSKASV